MSEPLVSILVPCHNAAPWLDRALRSARDQTWLQSEVIVVDDGSTDQSLAIARSFASSRCHVVTQEHAGAAAARNLAFRLSQGEFIQYLDADDLLDPDKIERHLCANRETDILTLGAVTYLYDWTGKKKPISLPELPPGGADPVQFLIELWCGEGPCEMIQTGQWLTSRRLIEQAGPWNKSLSVDDDGEFFTRVILSARRILAVPSACCRYRQFRRGKNLSATRDHASAMHAAILKTGYLLERDDSDRALKAVERLLSREVVEAYPAAIDVANEGLDYLRDLGLSVTRRIDGSPWFRRFQACLGWKFARQLQCHGLTLKKFLQADSSAPVPGAPRSAD